MVFHKKGAVSPLASNTRSPLFFGWYVLAACFVILFLTSGARFTIGVVFKPLMAEFGWDRSAVSLAFFANMTVFALSLLVTGRAYDRYGPRWVIAFSAVLLTSGFMGLALVERFWQFFLLYGVLAAVGMGGTTVPLVAALLSKWFHRHRGLAVSLGLAGSCLGQFILVPAFTGLVLRYGWRCSYFVLGLLMLVVILGLALFVIKGDPQGLGLKPWGYVEGGASEAGDDSRSAEAGLPDLGLRQAMRTRSFWLFVFVMFVCGGGDFLVTTHLIPMVTDYGISPAVAGNMLGWLGLLSLAGILVAGPLSDRIGTKIPIALTFLLRTFLFLLLLRFHTGAGFYFFSGAFGFTLLITAPLNAILVGRLFGFSNLGLISGFITTIHHIGGGFWAFMGGVIFDRTGSYHPAFIISAALSLMAFLCALLIREEKHRLPSP
ncbi:MAG: MFS transporter [Deltaproteobacteria bacterium]|nr:MFS transporter [Deltaproteobacteria bacterium]MBW2128797.1 MFS transporter [Deltaproteobacteria bacterium]